MNCTIDASVFVSAVRAEELYHTISRNFLRHLAEQGWHILCPTLLLPECAAAIARPTGNTELVNEAGSLIESLPGLHMVALELGLARRAAQIAILHRLRGADAVYAAVAEAFNATLITWDAEMLARCPEAVPTLTPAVWIEQQTT
jgi:predicted nucleic acid-binding protein